MYSVTDAVSESAKDLHVRTLFNTIHEGVQRIDAWEILSNTLETKHTLQKVAHLRERRHRSCGASRAHSYQVRSCVEGGNQAGKFETLQAGNT